MSHGSVAQAIYRDPRFDFGRVLDLQGATLHATYELENTSGAPLPWMWSQHCLLAARPGERIVLEGLTGFSAGGGSSDWPIQGERDLSCVGDISDGFALKVYATGAGRIRATLQGGEGGLAFEWDGAQLPALGLWLDWGGWPEDEPVHQLAIEPTTAPCDDLAQADALAMMRVLAPGERVFWRMAMTLTDPV
jgi:hypothetical protein